MEDSLQSLIKGNSEAIRNTWAMAWKQQGGKVIGVLSSYVPEEVIWAAGMLPWRITGTWKENISNARLYRSQSSCSYCNHVLESLLSGELDFLDGIVTTDLDQDMLRLGDVMLALNKLPFCEIMHIPFVDSELNYKFLNGEIRRLISCLEKYGEVKITEDALRESINTYNQMRKLVNSVYELRKRETPPLTGSEFLGITTAAAVMPKTHFNIELEKLLGYLETRDPHVKNRFPRILLSSEMLDNPAYVSLVEENCLVAMDDMDTGSRYFMQEVDAALEDPADALARRYLNSHGAPRMASWNKQAEQLIKWVKEFNIDGVLALPLAWCYPQRYRMPFLTKKFDEAGIPSLSLEREYHLTNVGQLRTRIGAFVEMLSLKREIHGSK